MDLNKFNESRHQRIMNTKKLLEEFAKENLSAEHAQEVLDILKDIPEDKKSTETEENK
ncbi:MAG: hypothetical protein J1F61_04735 [Clostridiales bacterium]|nr:hypothetical protein [Clostridiales bacterium]